MDKEGKQAEMTRLSCHRFRLNSGEQNNKPVRSCAMSTTRGLKQSRPAVGVIAWADNPGKMR
jgi:hypothetical protein